MCMRGVGAVSARRETASVICVNEWVATSRVERRPTKPLRLILRSGLGGRGCSEPPGRTLGPGSEQLEGVRALQSCLSEAQNEE